jgi:hypothetical protein
MMATNTREADRAGRREGNGRPWVDGPDPRQLLEELAQDTDELVGEHRVALAPLLAEAQAIVDEIFPAAGPSQLSVADYGKRQQRLEEIFDTIEDLLAAFTLIVRK